MKINSEPTLPVEWAFRVVAVIGMSAAFVVSAWIVVSLMS